MYVCVRVCVAHPPRQPEGFGAQQADIELIEDEPVYATAEVEALRRRIVTALDTYATELAECYDKERLEVSKPCVCL